MPRPEDDFLLDKWFLKLESLSPKHVGRITYKLNELTYILEIMDHENNWESTCFNIYDINDLKGVFIFSNQEKLRGFMDMNNMNYDERDSSE